MRDVDLETAILTENQVHPQGAFVPLQAQVPQPYFARTAQTQEQNRRRLAHQIEAGRLQEECLEMLARARAERDFNSLVNLQALSAQLAAAQAQAALAAQQAPVQPPAQPIQIEKAKVELTEADIYDPSPVFERPLKRVEGVEID
jgi:hypothetical protein